MRLASLTDSRILIVDDQTANLKALGAVLDFAGYGSVKCLSDSREVLPTVEEFCPDLILLDLHMPHVDGLEVLDQLRQVIPEQDYVPVLVLTGDASSEAKERALSHGASDFLSKPLNHTEVELRVRNLFQTRWFHRQLKEQNASLERQLTEGRELAEKLAETNRRLRETQTHLVQSEKMASLGQLVAGIAHEINNPLAFVLNNLFIVEERLGRIACEPGVERLRARVKDTQEGAERVKDLVSKLRTFSRLDEGTFKTVNIHESIESVLLFLRHKTEGRIEVERHYAAPDELSCFAGELNQVLMNVVANAIDSIEGPGKITLRTKHEDGFFVMTVRDTGKGIPAEIRNRVFEPFFTTKPVGSGTGLGLAISYGIIKAHHGSIEFSTEDGHGTEFIIKIPTSLHTETTYDINERETASTCSR